MEELQFQIIDILTDDILLSDDDKEFVLTFYGKTEENRDVVCNVVGFKPYFYLRVPGNWGSSSTSGFLKNVGVFINNYKKGNYGNWSGNYIREKLEIKKCYNFYGFNYNIECDKIQDYKFARICFNNYGDMRKCISAIQEFHKNNFERSSEGKIAYEFGKNKQPKIISIDSKIKGWFEQEHNCDCLANLYEAKLHPMLRFLHEKNIKSCGWVSVKAAKNKFVQDEEKVFNVDIEINNIHMKNINPIERDSIAGFITASFDIECDSSHGDFPNPVKDFKRVAIDMYESYFRTSQILNTFNMKKMFIRKCLKECFNGGSNDIQNIYTINGKISEESLDEIMNRITEDTIKRLDTSKESTKSRDSIITDLGLLFDNIENEKGEKIKIKGDPIIQIGTVFHRYGDKECYNRTMVIIGNEDKPDEKVCDDIPGVEVLECESEKELLLKWKDLILYHNPDIITGYNIFGFDFDYINKRVDYLFPCCSRCKKTKTYSNCAQDCPKNDFYRLGRLMRNRESDRIKDLKIKSKTLKSQKYYGNHWEKRCQVQSKQLSSSGLGDNVLKYISMDGRIVFDIQKEIQKGHALESYKLDDVSSHFMKGRIIESWLMVDPKLKRKITRIKTNTLGNLKQSDYVTFNVNTKYGLVKYENGKKFKVIGLNNSKDKCIGIDGNVKTIEKQFGSELISYEWCLAKDDISPQQIFDYHKTGGSAGRAKIAKYCIMDCELCIHLLRQLDIVPNNIGMATVSWVPLSYIFLRGQGVKINSIITKECSEKNTRIPTLKGFTESKLDDGFEGAIVLEPTPGIYLDDPVSVLDYASLYPSSIIEKNLSHETFICTQKDIDENPKKYKPILERLGEENYWVIHYDDYVSELKGKTVHKYKADTKTTCYFVKNKRNEDDTIIKKSMGIIPTVLQTLLEQRKATRKRIKLTDDENKKKVLDGFQLAYKVTANSVYGQMGAKTSSVFFKKIAACTTAIGRERIYDAEKGVKEWAMAENYNLPEVIYGDTDSVFVKFSRKHHETNQILEGKEALKYCIEQGVKAGEWITENRMSNPQDLEYEKTFYPFILISKKRYTGDKYELSADKPKERTSMGLVTKRRDNAPIVKYVFGNIIEIIINQRSVDKAFIWLKGVLDKIKEGKMDQSMFIISKSLRGYYKNPQGIAHKVLADRMAERNPGNKPKPNDRIPYAYIKMKDTDLYDYNNRYKSGKNKGKPKPKKILQGDRIENPDFIKEKSLKLDYGFYISNQIMNPVKQVLDLEKSEDETKMFFETFIN